MQPTFLAGVVDWTSLEVWQLLATTALGIATILVYLSIRAVQKQEANASDKLASIAELQNEKSQARLEVIRDPRYEFRRDPVHSLASHPSFKIQLANTGWKGSDLLRCKTVLIPARATATSTGSPHSEILRDGEPRDDLFVPAGRLGRFRIALEPQHLKEPFRFGDYHVAFEISPVNGKPVVSIIENPGAEIACPEDWADRLASAQARPHP